MHVINTGRKTVFAALFIVLMGLCSAARAAGSSQDAELAKELQNPVADLITLPLESRFDFGGGNKLRYTLNIQPVLPFELGPNLVLVSRTILPVIYAEAVGNDQRSRTGLGDTSQSFFLAPREPVNGWIYGAGPVLRLPTATESELGDGVWGAGPTAVALRQDDAWTYGLLASHIWSFAGRSGSTVNATSLQPFLSYTNSSLTTFGLGSEAAYDWEARQWLVPLDVTVSQLVRIGNTPVDFAVGGRSYLDRPAGGPNWGIKFTVTFMLPK